MSSYKSPKFFNFQYSIDEIALFGRFLGPLIWSNFAEIFTKCSTLANKNIFWKFFEIFKFSWKRNGLKVCTFGPTLTVHFPQKMKEIKKNKQHYGKTSAIGLFKYVKIKALSLLTFLGKIWLLFHYLGYFWQETGHGHKSQGPNQNFKYPITPTRFLVNFLSKNLIPTLSSFAAIGHKWFSSLAAFLGTTHKFLKKMSQISWCRTLNNRMLNQLASISNPKMKNQKARVPFSNYAFLFWNQFN